MGIMGVLITVIGCNRGKGRKNCLRFRVYWEAGLRRQETGDKKQDSGLALGNCCLHCIGHREIEKTHP